MIQELFGASATGILNQDPNPSPSSSTTTTATATTTSENQKLRCPRCDSSHTKFCYYNNYNLTQPRHFCKTCRRYWTKGGALRNVPIGGGCRKNKSSTSSFITGKLKAAVSSELGKPSIINGLEPESNPNGILWSTPPQTSHLLSLFRATQNPNPNFATNPVSHIKDQSFIAGSNMGSFGFEPPLGLCSSLWRNSQQVHQNQHEVAVQNTANYYHHDQPGPAMLGGHMSNASSSTSASTILDSAPVLASGELGFWNQTLPWSDLAATNGAYH